MNKYRITVQAPANGHHPSFVALVEVPAKTFKQAITRLRGWGEVAIQKCEKEILFNDGVGGLEIGYEQVWPRGGK